MLPTILKIFEEFLPKNSAAGKKVRNLLSNGGIFIELVSTDGNERIWYRYSNITRAAQRFTVSIGNTATSTVQFFMHM